MSHETSIAQQQLTLGVRLLDQACFENFLVGGNGEALAEVRKLTETNTGFIFLYGDPSSGKTHLLYAAQKFALANGIPASYLSLSDQQLSQDMLIDSKPGTLMCIDDLHALAGVLEHERTLLALIEQQRINGGALLVASAHSPGAMSLKLADVKSRLSSGVAYRLQVLSETERRQALYLRARSRGFELTAEVVRYVMTRYPRDLKALFELLDRIDSATLTAKRPVTVPFLKKLEREVGAQESENSTK